MGTIESNWDGWHGWQYGNPTSRKKTHESCEHCKHYRSRWSNSFNGSSFKDVDFIENNVIKELLLTLSIGDIVSISHSFGGASKRYRRNW